MPDTATSRMETQAFIKSVHGVRYHVKDVARSLTFYTQDLGFTVVRPVRRVNVDLTHGMLRQLDERAARLNISRQAVIKTLLVRALHEERAIKPGSQKKSG